MFARYRAFIWRNGNIEPVVHPDKISISSLKGYEIQRGLVVDNTKAFLNGIHCNNCQNYGDRGRPNLSYSSQNLRTESLKERRKQPKPEL